MNTITIQIPDEYWLKLQAIATHRGVSVADLVLMGIEELLNQQKVSFKDATDYVLCKNTELYKRLV